MRGARAAEDRSPTQVGYVKLPPATPLATREQVAPDIIGQVQSDVAGREHMPAAVIRLIWVLLGGDC